MDYSNCFQDVIGSDWKQTGKHFLKFALAMKTNIRKLDGQHSTRKTKSF